jgi:hypothetical protein
MAQTTKDVKTFTATEALAIHRRVKLTSASGTAVEYADQSDSDSYIGTVLKAASLGASVPISLRSQEKTEKGVAADTFAAGAALYAADDGKISDTSSGNCIGTALEAATAAGDVVEWLPDLGGSASAISRASITQEDAESYPVPLSEMRVHDAPSTVLPAAAANDDLGCIAGTYGTTNQMLQTVDFGETTTTAYARFQFALPPEYQDGETVTLVANAGMITAIADDSCTLDVEAVRIAAPSVDICATAAQSINSLTAADKSFTLTPTSCVAGDLLDIRLTVTGTDASTSATAVIGAVKEVSLALDIKG